ncbi:ribonuclease T [Pseudidiomarina terrestris]|uniref:Ribonuclease T n=1 Tax=Pseudidiomarina terrestris TaxID=2820060 RepID=A0AAW7QXB5_9GAMM|nr:MULTISPECIES: ribonuclease T [unclassified Pseudidiomarina]MDN7123468.1 ribonuclease T [Pseudidiomarina sp. 1APP75-32.1]MDN7126742.1 ribonuclease T [Pseudidiomarina sp. 1APR75-33.1]MDN7128807.1 ribonuclease T [Pseudidiomarina sp. 1APR75-15]MDN7134925.1 ribonuclease T [Pseudidiomarina sp. 1ASP75-5]MDN7137604.1 ribonuclease T [Pseudidiomarina sp. 1ASP75-14]
MSEPGPSLMKQRFRGYLPVVIDVETAGFNANTDALLEIAAVTLEFDEEGWLHPAERIHYHVAPFDGANIEQAAIDFNGIDPHSPLRGAVPEDEALKEMFKPIRKAQKEAGCQRCVLVGHNATFDLGFLMAAAERSALKRNPFHPFVTFDTAALAALTLGQTVLIKACQEAGIAFDSKQAHSALYDTERTAELFCWMVNRYKNVGGWPLNPQPSKD